MDKILNEILYQMSKMNDQFESMDNRFDSIDKRFEKIDENLGHLNKSVGNLEIGQKEIKEIVTRIEVNQNEDVISILKSGKKNMELYN